MFRVVSRSLRNFFALFQKARLSETFNYGICTRRKYVRQKNKRMALVLAKLAKFQKKNKPLKYLICAMYYRRREGNFHGKFYLMCKINIKHNYNLNYSIIYI